jgi:hypothetical protein
LVRSLLLIAEIEGSSREWLFGAFGEWKIK